MDNSCAAVFEFERDVHQIAEFGFDRLAAFLGNIEYKESAAACAEQLSAERA